MANWAIVRGGVIVDTVRGHKGITTPDGIQHPSNAFDLWSAAELKSRLDAWPLLPGVVPPEHRIIGTASCTVNALAETVTENFLTEPEPPPIVITPLPPVLPVPMGASIPALRDEVVALTAVVNDLRAYLLKREIAP